MFWRYYTKTSNSLETGYFDFLILTRNQKFQNLNKMLTHPNILLAGLFSNHPFLNKNGNIKLQLVFLQAYFL